MFDLKSILKVSVYITALLFLLSFSFAEFPSCESMVGGLNFSHDSSVKSMSAEFCRKIVNQKCEDNGDIFDANQSVFFSLFCDNVGAGDQFIDIVRDGDGSIIKKTSFDQFDISDYNITRTINYCDHTKNVMNGCDFSIHLPNMFDEIINDYFNIIQASLYGIDGLTEDFDTQNYANNFSMKHFVGLEICNPDSEYYKKSCNYLKDYMKNARNLLTKTKVIDVLKLTEQNKDIDCETEFSDNLLYCGLLGDRDTANYSFVNIVYNEYMRYRLFMSYYSYNLSKDPRYSSLNSSSNIDKIAENKEKVFTAQNETFKIRSAINIALRSLSEISGSFPIHIGFVMYQEDANMFMKSLVKIYPPIRTLFDKFRNVQRAE